MIGNLPLAWQFSVTQQPKKELILGVTILVVIASAVIAVPILNERLNNRLLGPKYAMLVGKLLVDYMKANDNRWPSEWEDLAPYDRNGQLIPEARESVAIDFSFKPSSADTTVDRYTHGVPIASVTLTNGKALDHDVHPDPNVIVFDYLKRLAESKP